MRRASSQRARRRANSKNPQLDSMLSFDLVNFHDAGVDALAPRLGYKKIFKSGVDVEISARGVGDWAKRSKLITNGGQETDAKALKQNGVIGVLPQGMTVTRKVLDIAKDEEKPIIIPMGAVTNTQAGARIQELSKMRKLVRSVLMADAPFALVSLADGKELMMSSLQMLEMAGFLSIDMARAKTAMGRMGELI